VSQDARLERLGQGRQAYPANADPLRHARARNTHVQIGTPDLA
jgi:hypothetical protein